jgi:ABC-type lipoprotein release transport system permease subunit
MKIPIKYIIRNLGTRKLTTGITVLGVALVVFVFAAVLMMAYGVQKTLTATGSDENVIIARKAANGEISSIIDRVTADIIMTLPNIARTPDGKPLASGEPVDHQSGKTRRGRPEQRYCSGCVSSSVYAETAGKAQGGTDVQGGRTRTRRWHRY